eukprot:TRINITY_DN6322_c0_g1_i1.p1 TRINITY_DN6322_c0_g1~~TRINITY_DN6322_c0_g1_i1.p1  ORF type:complete len:108 (-),score=11.16 TRINITY_DN6322_c0_g1_i1:7-330(-)
MPSLFVLMMFCAVAAVGSIALLGAATFSGPPPVFRVRDALTSCLHVVVRIAAATHIAQLGALAAAAVFVSPLTLLVFPVLASLCPRLGINMLSFRDFSFGDFMSSVQ